MTGGFTLFNIAKHFSSPLLFTSRIDLLPTICCWLSALLMIGTLSSLPLHAHGIQDEQPQQENKLGIRYLKNLAKDQKAIWTSPAHIRSRQLPYLIPLFSAGAGLIASDSAASGQLSNDPSRISLSHHIASYGAAASVIGGASFYFYGRVAKNEQARETGVLSSEAGLDSLAVAETLKMAFNRERPSKNLQGRFFQGGSSFPSEHAALTWSIASVISHEYPRPLMKTLAYGTATAVSLSRISSLDHFPSDVFIGGVFGYLIGQHVYSAHHNQDLSGANIGTFMTDNDLLASGTTFVPMDSWVYPAFDRLAALGFVDTGLTGLRPWTRTECARLLQEAAGGLSYGGADTGISTLYKALEREFSPEIDRIDKASESRIENIYVRASGLSGEPLADDYHFAKTFVNDFGRPFGQGANAIAGISARTAAGPFGIYVRGEYQHGGTLPGASLDVLQAIARADATPFAVPNRTDSVDRFRFLDSYVSFKFGDNLISFGKQTLWWGPGADAPFLFSNNAEPLPLLRINRASPFSLPWIFHYLGAIRFELVWGQLNGQNFVALQDPSRIFTPPIHPHTYLHGEKFSFKPTRNFEFGFAETTLFSGPGFPMTVGNFLRSYSVNNTAPGAPGDPGDRRSAFDFSYRIPGLRDWVTFYGDSFTEDEFSPVSYPRKSSFRAGLYLPRLPELSALDLRVEGLYTDIPNLDEGRDAGVAYFNARFRSGYTNFGQIIGNSIGREGRGFNAWATYHLSAQSDVQIHYRNEHVNHAFLQGGVLRDFGINGTIAHKGSLLIGASLQYEHWAFPQLAPSAKSNVSAGINVRYEPIQGWKLW